MTDTETAPSTWWDRLYDAGNADTNDADVPPLEPAAEKPDAAPQMPAEDEPEEAAEDVEPVGKWWSKLTRQAAEDPRVEPEPTTAAPVAPVATVPGQPIPVPAIPVPQGMSRTRKARWRWTLYNGSAALFGWGVGLMGLDRSWLHMGQQAPTGTAALILALAAGTTVWRLCGRTTGIPYKAALQLGASLAASSFAYQFAPAATQALTGTGFAPTLVVPIATGVTIYALTWHLIDRRTRTWWPPLAWTMRVPLASAALALALYTTR